MNNMLTIMIPVATAIVSLLVGSVVGYAIRKHSWEQKLKMPRMMLTTF